MKILAIDPGPKESAWCYYDGSFLVAKKEPNEYVLDALRRGQWDPEAVSLAVEMIASYGMAVGEEVFTTCVWIGRYIQAWDAWQGQYTLVKRLEVKLHLCHDSRAKDANIRAALLDRFGAQGTKKAPGVTYGLSGDMWAALALAVTVADRKATP
jgi:hypothetical protein